jgi:hypothetical protein
LLRLPCVFGDCFDRLAPRRFLPPVEFAQVKDVTLEDPSIGATPVFHNAPVEVLLAIFAAFRTTEKHDGRAV